MRLILIGLALLLSSSFIYPASSAPIKLGIKSGVTYTSITGQDSVSRPFSPGSNIMFGTYLTYPFGQHTSLQMNLIYAIHSFFEEGDASDIFGIQGATYRIDYDIHYLKFPIEFHVTHGMYDFFVGPYAGILLDSKESNYISSPTTARIGQEYNNKGSTRNLDYGVCVGTSLILDGLTLSFQMSQSFTPFPTETLDLKGRSMSFILGGIF